MQDFSRRHGCLPAGQGQRVGRGERLDEKFCRGFNDVDFCLRVRDKGYRIVWTPYAQLTHYESKSRGGGEKDPVKPGALPPSSSGCMPCTARANILHDPYYNPNLHDGRGFFRKQ